MGRGREVRGEVVKWQGGGEWEMREVEGEGGGGNVGKGRVGDVGGGKGGKVRRRDRGGGGGGEGVKVKQDVAQRGKLKEGGMRKRDSGESKGESSGVRPLTNGHHNDTQKPRPRNSTSAKGTLYMYNVHVHCGTCMYTCTMYIHIILEECFTWYMYIVHAM